MKNVRIAAVLSIAILFLCAGEASALFDNKYVKLQTIEGGAVLCYDKKSGSRVL